MTDEDEFKFLELDEFISELEGKSLSEATKDVTKILSCLFREVSALKKYQEQLHQLVPLQYRKTFPKPGENPFFNANEFVIPTDPEELEFAKKKMADLLSKGKMPLPEFKHTS